MTRLAVIAVALVTLATAAPAAAQVQVPAKPQTASLDSEAPPGAPPHWLPGEDWVMQHWLPYDERRLYRLLGADRGTVWRWLRDDTRNLAGLALSRGKDPRAIAAALVEPWRGKLRDPARLKLLESRALRTLTQGHLAQHMFFHSLHQDAIPDRAREIFGTASREEFQALRRSELSPIQICRLNGLGRAHAERAAVAALKEEVRRGVDGQAIPAVQARRLLGRQLRQVPRWLGQRRYNGPPPLKLPRPSVATASNYSATPAIAGDGRSVAFESYEAGLAQAKTRGEIGVLAGPAGGGKAPAPVWSPDRAAAPTPHSDYNPSVSADGRFVAFESSAGNLNFAKRYGQMGVFVRDLRRGGTVLASRTDLDLGARAVPRSAYDPSISGDGRFVAYASSESLRGRLDVFVRDLRRQTARRIAPPRGATGLAEPALSGDGRVLAFSALAGAASTAAGAAPALTSATTAASGSTEIGASPELTSGVFARDLRSGRTRRVSEPGAEAYEPSVSAGGNAVAYTVMASGRRSRVEIHDARTGARRVVAPAPGDGLAPGASASEPSVSADGRRVAFTVRLAGGRRSHVYVADLDAGTTLLASRGAGVLGPPASGRSAHPSLSADGRRVAFTSDAHDLSRAKCNGARGIFVRDVESATTTLVSRRDGLNRYAGPTRGSSTGADAVLTLTCR